MKNLLLFLSCFLFFSFTGGNKKPKNDLTKENIHGKVKSITTYYYVATDSIGILVKQKLSLNYTFTYDSSGFGTEYEVVNDTALPLIKAIYKHDSTGHIIEMDRYEHSNYMKDGDHLERNLYTYTYRYDSHGNAVEIKANKNGKRQIRYVRKFDANNNLLEEKVYQPQDSLCNIITYLYDEKGNMTEMDTYNAHNAFQSSSKYQYDRQGNYTEDDEVYGGGKYKDNTAVTYSNFDKHGNWLKNTSVRNDKTLEEDNSMYSITERTIEYY